MTGPHKSPLICGSELSFSPFPAQGAVRFLSLLHSLLQVSLAHCHLPKGEEEEWLREQQIPPEQLDMAAVPQLPIPVRETRRRQIWFLPLKILTDLLQALGGRVVFPGWTWALGQPCKNHSTPISLLCAEIFHLAVGTYFFHAHGNIGLRSKRHRIPLSQVSFGGRKRPAAFSSPPSRMHISPELCHLASVHLALIYGKPFLTWYSSANIPVISWQKRASFRMYTHLVKSVLSHSASSLLRGMRKCSLASVSMWE